MKFKQLFAYTNATSNIKQMTEIVFPAVYERTKLITQKEKETFDQTHKLIDIPVGAEIILKILQKNNKLDPNYIGLYKVLRITKGGSYVLQNEKGQIEPRNYPPSLLKLVNGGPVKSNDKFYDCEAIIAHKKVNGQYLYNVRWKGYTEEPSDSFVDPKFINEYWKRIGVVPENLSWKNKYKEHVNTNLINNQVQRTRRITRIPISGLSGPSGPSELEK
jgi:hypothetical protein